MPMPTSRRIRRRGAAGAAQDAFEPLGIRAGSFLLKPAVEVTRGLDSNPSHIPNGELGLHHRGADAETAIELGAPRFRADLRGSYSNYDSNSSLSSPLVDAKTYARFDVTRDTKVNLDSRLFLSTDYPAARTCRPTSPSCRSTRPTATRSA